MSEINAETRDLVSRLGPKTLRDGKRAIILTDAEFVDLVHHGGFHGSFGPGWAGLVPDETQPPDRQILRVATLRGVLHENRDGAGI